MAFVSCPTFKSTLFQVKMILLHGRILRGFPFGNDIMPARSAAVDLYRISLPPRHRAKLARWRGGKENLKRASVPWLRARNNDPFWKPTHDTAVQQNSLNTAVYTAVVLFRFGQVYGRLGQVEKTLASEQQFFFITGLLYYNS